ncbi:MAG: virginiamycin lyase [Candidatus Eremiobacteraeota bacterium]|jgi:virginiamycin B lyase|nr:virginiamycin lyase [Candidatus Eremiobacteraeota bacterium]
MVRRVMTVAFAVALSGCGGGGASVAPPAPRGGDRALTTISFVIRVPAGTSTASRGRRPAYVSPSTQSLTIANSTGTILVTANLTPQSAGCTAPTASTPLTCTASASVPSGTNTLTIATYDAPGATGKKLAVAALQVTGAANGPTTINLTLSGIVASLTLALDPPALPSGTAARSAVLLNALDPDGNVIVGPETFADANGNALTITLTNSDASGKTSLAKSTFTAPGGTDVSYNGAALASATITASAPGVTSKTATLTIAGSSAFVSEFRGGIANNSSPAGIALGPDGNLWFTEQSGDRIGRVTPRGVVTEFSAGITPFSNPTAITAGPDGNLWFTENAGFSGASTTGRIGRITTAGVITEFSTGIPSGAHPAGIAAGSDGNLWFSDTSAPRVGRITPAGAVTMFATGITGNAVSVFLSPCAMAKGPNGNVWWLEADKIAQITPAGTVTEYPLATFASGVAPGPDGNVWFTEGSNIDRITPSGTITRFPAQSAACITPGADGNLWFTAPFVDNVGKITPTGTVTNYDTTFGITSFSAPFGIAAGSDGNLWFTEQSTPGVGRVNIR